MITLGRYPANVTRRELTDVYHASSDHQLLDQLVLCVGCGMEYLNPRPHPDIIVESYTGAEDPTFVEQNPERIRTFRKVLDRIVRRFDLPRRSLTLLDVGCAGGAFPKAAHDAGFRVTGIEPSHWLARYGSTEYGLDIRQGLLSRGMFPDGSFDVVSLWDVIEHLTDPAESLKVIRDSLKPGGLLIVNYPDIGSWAARLLGRRWPFWLSVHLLYYNRQTMTRQLQQSGFQVLDVRPHWQALKLGYVLQRAIPLFPPARLMRRAVEAIGLGGMPLTYAMGQTLMVARKTSG